MNDQKEIKPDIGTDPQGRLEALVRWALDIGVATGHADTEQDLLDEVGSQIEEMKEKLHKMMWHDIDDCPEGQMVLMFSPTKLSNLEHPLESGLGVFIGFLWRNPLIICDDSGCKTNHKVTQWQPLPRPPGAGSV